MIDGNLILNKIHDIYEDYFSFIAAVGSLLKVELKQY